jgi:hypothetical protein
MLRLLFQIVRYRRGLEPTEFSSTPLHKLFKRGETLESCTLRIETELKYGQRRKTGFKIASGLAWVYALAGKQKEATRVLDAFNELAAHSYVDFYQVGVIYAGLGNKDRAFQELEKGYAERSPSMVYIKADPFWDESVRSDPRYANLLRRMGLPQ